jgi:hypothetical protein
MQLDTRRNIMHATESILKNNKKQSQSKNKPEKNV